MKSYFYFFPLLFLSSCISQVRFEKNEFQIVDESEKAEYWISKGKPEGKNLVFLFPDNLDSINWEKSPLLKSLQKENYKIVIPQLMGKKESNQIILDTRSRRIKTLTNLYLQLLTKKEIDSLANIVLIGFGESAYILPYLAIHLPRVQQFFMVNAGLGSPLSEFQQLVSEGNNSFLKTPKMRFFGIDNLQDMKRIIQEIFTFPEFDIRLGNKTNHYWKDFYTNPTDADLAIAPVKGNIIFSSDYPFVSKSSKSQLKLQINSNPLSTLEILEIKGKGDFRLKNEITDLKKSVLTNLD